MDGMQGFAADATSGLMLPNNYGMLAGKAPREDDDKDVGEERASHVTKWQKKITRARDEHWKGVFRAMREDMKFAAGIQWDGQQDLNDDRYVANMVLRHIQQKTATLYARNPKVYPTRKPRVEFSLWDEKPESLQMAMQGAMMGDPQSAMLIAEVQQVAVRRMQLERVGRTLVALFDYYAKEQDPPLKTMLKQLVRRVLTCGVGYIKIDFQRIMGRTPDIEAKIDDFSQRIARLERIAKEMAEDEIGPGDSQLDEMRTEVATLMQTPEIILREGVTFEFPLATAIIVDPACTQLKGFIGAGWIAQEYHFTAEKIEEIYGVDVGGSGAKQYGQRGELLRNGGRVDDGCANYRVWEVYHKAGGQMLTICDGHKDFLEEPRPPRVMLERFWPITVLTFNDVENADPESGGSIYPPSDVRLMRSMQREHNRSREGLREHRIANRPAYVAGKNTFTKDEKYILAHHELSEVIFLENVPPGTDPRTLVAPLEKAPIDAAVYETAPFFDDAQKVVGSQEANWGGTSGVAATEVSVAEGARLSSVQSNVDDLDDALSEVARSFSQVALAELTPETVKEIVGEGAAWPTLTGEQIAKELYLDIRAGSSGRPNRAAELANFERLAPTLLQIPGIPPRMLAEEAIRRLDDSIDLSEAYVEGLPAIVTMNRMAGAQPSTGDPATDPQAQGPEGADKTPNPQETPQGAQPAYPAAGEQEGLQ